MLAVFQLDPKHSVRQSFQHLCHDFYRFFLRHILSEWSFDAADKPRIIARGIPFAKARQRLALSAKSATKLLPVPGEHRWKRGSAPQDLPRLLLSCARRERLACRRLLPLSSRQTAFW